MASAIVDMYSRCGSLEDACRIFNRAQDENVTLWTAMLESYAAFGQGRMEIEFFNGMKEENITPNDTNPYRIVPSIENHNCMVDVYGPAGFVEKEKNFIEENNISDEAIVWETLLSARRVHKHIEYAKLASEKLIQNIYATNRKWLDTFNLRSSILEKRVRKQPGQSWIHLKNEVHTFLAGLYHSRGQLKLMLYLGRLM
ncbi:hypothetical protein EJB05_13358, partial [Eragrostis curvula]